MKPIDRKKLHIYKLNKNPIEQHQLSLQQTKTL